ncbi:MAG: nucleoside phosphorylase [Thermoplasmata archaeon]
MRAPITSGLPDNESVLNPSDLTDHIERMKGKKPPKVPKFCILAFFVEMYPVVERRFNPRVIHYPSEDNPVFYPIHVFEHKGLDLAFVFPGVGAPNAAIMLEMMIAFGGQYFVVLSAPGTLTETIGRGEIIVPTKALRDEGTSFHYEEPSRYSYPSELMLKCITETLAEKKVPFHEGGTWTTDALFRETEKEVHDYHQEGCLAVEMETAALFSVTRFREKDIGALFAAGDCVAGKKWDPRKAKDGAGKREEENGRLLDYALDTFRLLDRKLEDP